MKTTKKVEEKPKRGRPSKQKTVFIEKKTKKDKTIKTKVEKVVELKDEVVIDEQVVEPVITGETTSSEVVINTIEELKDVNVIELPEDKYYKEKTSKKQIVLHHTASGPGIKGDINYYLRNNDKSGTHYIIERNGKITQIIDSDYWCHHLKIRNGIFRNLGLSNLNNDLNKSSISIDLDSWGELEKINDNRYRNIIQTPITVLKENVSYYEKGFRGKNYYQKYSTEQLESLKKLLVYLSEKHNISLEYKESMFEINKNALLGENGVWTHVSYRDDVNNCHPDSDLIDLLKSLK